MSIYFAMAYLPCLPSAGKGREGKVLDILSIALPTMGKNFSSVLYTLYNVLYIFIK